MALPDYCICITSISIREGNRFITLILIGKHDKTRDTTYVCVVINSAAL